MSRETTLKRVEDDVRSGNLGKARDRLNGLMRTYPDDLSLRARIADIYWQLQYPHMAGRYWYLENDQRDHVQQAISVFEKRCGHDPWIIWDWVKFRGNPEAMPAYARQRLDALTQRCKQRDGHYPKWRKGRTQRVPTAKRKWLNGLFALACVTVVVIIVLSIVVGLVTMIGWLW